MSALKRWSFFCNRAHEMAPDFGDDGIRPHRNPCGLYCLASEVSALEARVKELEEQVRWIPVNEKLPEKGQWATISSNGVVQYTAYRYHPFEKQWEPFDDSRGRAWLEVVVYWRAFPHPCSTTQHQD